MALRSVLPFRFALSKLQLHAGVVALQPQCHYVTGKTYPTPPKRPATPLFQVLEDIRAKDKDSKIPVVVLAKMAGEKYRGLDGPTKQSLLDKYRKSLEVYHVEMKSYMDKLTPEQKEQLKNEKQEKRKKKAQMKTRKLMKKLNKPKKSALSAYSVFIQSGSLDRGDAPASMFMKGASDVWNRMAEEDKQVYVDQAKANQQKYREELAQWEKQMIAEGHPEYVRVQSRPKEPRKRAAKKTKAKTTTKAAKKTTKAAKKEE